jgi:NAD(P)-dependent dehydrogenase (short-subunit alcohol dehydrogenase family)
MDLSGKICVLTGASSGIGRTAAIDLARRGMVMCVVARRESLLQQLVAELPGEGHSYFVADVSDLEQVRGLERHVRDEYGRLHALVNNAGFTRGGEFTGEDSLDAVRAVMDTNYLGTVNTCAVFLPLLEASAPSRIVNVASMAGRLAFPRSSAYVASKFAVVGWSESAAFDLKLKGISVSLIEPGPIPTEGFPQESMVGHPILGRALGSQQDVANAIRNAIVKGSPTRAVPRWYRPLQIPRLLAPPLYRFLAARLTRGHTVERD